MNSSKYNTFLTVLLIIIIVAIVGIIGFLGYKFISSENSKKEAENFVEISVTYEVIENIGMQEKIN